MPAVPKVEVDMASFYDALRRYEKVRRKTTDDCMWRQVRNWCIKTLNWLKREPKPQIPVFPTDKSGPNWPLVSWLAKQRGEYLGQRRVAYVRGRPETKAKKRRRVRHPLLKLSKKQKSARNKAVGFLRAMMIAAAAAARNRRAEQSDSGIKAIASGGTDFAQKNQKSDKENSFGGGAGMGVNVTPISFLVINEGNVRIIAAEQPASNTVDKVIELVPNVVDKVSTMVGKKKAGEPEIVTDNA